MNKASEESQVEGNSFTDNNIDDNTTEKLSLHVGENEKFNANVENRESIKEE